MVPHQSQQQRQHLQEQEQQVLGGMMRAAVVWLTCLLRTMGQRMTQVMKIPCFRCVSTESNSNLQYWQQSPNHGTS